MPKNKNKIVTPNFGQTLLTGWKRNFDQYKKTSGDNFEQLYLGFTGSKAAFGEQSKEDKENSTATSSCSKKSNHEQATKAKRHKAVGSNVLDDSLKSNGICEIILCDNQDQV